MWRCSLGVVATAQARQSNENRRRNATTHVLARRNAPPGRMTGVRMQRIQAPPRRARRRSARCRGLSRRGYQRRRNCSNCTRNDGHAAKRLMRSPPHCNIRAARTCALLPRPTLEALPLPCPKTRTHRRPHRPQQPATTRNVQKLTGASVSGTHAVVKQLLPRDLAVPMTGVMLTA